MGVVPEYKYFVSFSPSSLFFRLGVGFSGRPKSARLIFLRLVSPVISTSLLGKWALEPLAYLGVFPWPPKLAGRG